jgi:hypothetical protein
VRYLDPAYLRKTYSEAAAALPRPDDIDRVVYCDGYIYLMDVDRYGYSEAFWMPRNKLWAPIARKIA